LADLTPTRNRLLVSVPATGDANFEQTVVYVIDHDEAGAIGVVLNRPAAAQPPAEIDLGVPLASPRSSSRVGRCRRRP
jgi:putative transcriptional regulator